MNAAVRRNYVDPCRGRGLLFQASACEGGRILYGGRPSHFEQGKYLINILQRERVLGGILKCRIKLYESGNTCSIGDSVVQRCSIEPPWTPIFST